jgi:peptidoglycan/LPS O-acetylase OafA/YrhL
MLNGRQMSNPTYQINSFDGLRGLAVLIVFLSHTSNSHMHLLPFLDASGTGKAGVYLFFILSSCLLTQPFLRIQQPASIRKFLSNYAFRRFLRIYPLYCIVLLIGLVISWIYWWLIRSDLGFDIPFTRSIKLFAEQLLLIRGEGVTWSIPVECEYYFILPIIALTYRFILKNRPVHCALFSVTLIIICEILWPESNPLINVLYVGPYLPIFLIGGLCAVVFETWRVTPVLAGSHMSLILEVIGFAAIVILILMTPSAMSLITKTHIIFTYNQQYFIPFGLLWAAVLCACIGGTGILRRIFESRALRYLGFISFSFYLIHFTFIEIALRMGRTGIIATWLVLLATIIASTISWRLIERPTSRLRFSYKTTSGRAAAITVGLDASVRPQTNQPRP